VGNTLALSDLNELVTFSYLPVSHWNPDGSYACEVGAHAGDARIVIP